MEIPRKTETKKKKKITSLVIENVIKRMDPPLSTSESPNSYIKNEIAKYYAGRAFLCSRYFAYLLECV
jgi:hypothetical protein